MLGLWGALIPFVGPYVNLAYDPNTPWLWTAARGWLEVLPGAVTALGGLLLVVSRNRVTAMIGGWLAVVGGAWFVLGRLFATPLGLGDFGARPWLPLGRLSVRSVRDISHARHSVDAYRPDGFAGREPIARERVPVSSPQSEEESRRGLFGGPRRDHPIQH